ncbi:diamine N-acetyltransferase [Burkholderiales bacterium]|nr:MAG: ribosomal-protein-alanine N-acetyltransferase [Burkholderiales bacterium]CAG0997467.1 diamine N-acetyltransferase [Burkholderiales bacterium]
MRPEPQLRPMEPRDVPVVATLEALVYSHPWSAGNFHDSLAAGHCCTLAEVGGALAGYGVLMRGVDEAQLLNISVAPALRRKGVGQRLWEHFLNQAKAMGALQLSLEVRVSNVGALAFYARLGCRPVGRRRGYYPQEGGREDALLLALELSPTLNAVHS